VVNDTSEPRLIDMFARNGLNMQNANKGKDSIKEGIRELSKFQIIVTPESYNVKHELRNYVWNDKKASIPIDAHNHALDAMRYAATRLLQGSDFLADNI
jgi:phage terminase large subunit